MSDAAGFIIGVCKWYNETKGYGFLQLPGGGMDIFVHANQLKKSGIDRPLIEGERVRFSTNKGPKGTFAVNISLAPNDQAAA